MDVPELVWFIPAEEVASTRLPVSCRENLGPSADAQSPDHLSVGIDRRLLIRMGKSREWPTSVLACACSRPWGSHFDRRLGQARESNFRSGVCPPNAESSSPNLG